MNSHVGVHLAGQVLGHDELVLQDEGAVVQPPGHPQHDDGHALLVGLQGTWGSRGHHSSGEYPGISIVSRDNMEDWLVKQLKVDQCVANIRIY